jgi:hypothetical protein
MARAENVSFLLSQVRVAAGALVSGTVTFYEPGTTTKRDVWLDRAMTTLASNPYTLDANATAQLYAQGEYRVVVKDKAGTTKFDRDGLYFGQEGNETFMSVLDFGALGDGATDDSYAFSDAFTALAALTNGALYIPAGVYRLESLVEQALPAEASYRIYGDGPATIILGKNAAGAIKLTCSGRHAYVALEDMSFAPGLTDSGTAFEYTSPEGGVSQRRVFEARNLVFEPVDSDDSTSDWTNPLVVTGINRPLLDNVVIWRQSGSPKCDTIVNLDYCYAPEINNCYLNGFATYGITNVRTDSNEGFFLFDTIINGADTGVYLSQSGRHPQVYIRDCHLNCFVANIHLIQCKYIFISQNLLYTRVGTGVAFDDIILDDCDSAYISKNTYRTGTGQASDRRHAKLINNTQLVKIDDNGLNGITTLKPYYIDASCSEIEINLPNAVPAYDFASYPATDPLDLVECLSASVIAKTPSSIGQWASGSTHGPDLDLKRYSASPAAGDTVGSFRVFGQNDAGEMVMLGSVAGRIVDPTDGSEDGQIYIYGAAGGSPILDIVAGGGVSIGNDDVQGQGTINIKGKDSLAIRLNNTIGIYFGDADPEASVPAAAGSLYLRSNGSFYRKASGSGNTGWSAVT